VITQPTTAAAIEVVEDNSDSDIEVTGETKAPLVGISAGIPGPVPGQGGGMSAFLNANPTPGVNQANAEFAPVSSE